MSHTFDYVQLLNEMPRPDWIKKLPQQPRDEAYAGISAAVKQAKTPDGNLIKYTDELVEVNLGQLNSLLDDADNTQVKRKMGLSTIIFGHAGIGKSALMKDRAYQRAAMLGREVKTKEEILEMSDTIEALKANLEKYFVLMIEAASSIDPTMVTGIPNPATLERKGYLQEASLPWVTILTITDKAAGLLFLDEFNLADEVVQKPFYSVLNFNERNVGQYAMKGNWRIHCAGNWGEGYQAEPLRLAVDQRLIKYYLQIDFEGWSKWADQAKTVSGQPLIFKPLMDFIRDEPKNFFTEPNADADVKSTPNPRNLESLSAALYEIMGNSDPTTVTKDAFFRMIAKSAGICGKEFASRFEKFLRDNADFDIIDILNSPQKLTDPSSSETVLTNMKAYLRKSLVQYVKTFDDKFMSVGEGAKQELVDLGLNYFNCIEEVFDASPPAAIEIFGSIVQPEIKKDYNLTIDGIVRTLEARGERGGAAYIKQLAKKLSDEVTSNANAVKGASKKKGGQPTAFLTGEEEEEGTSIESGAAQKVIDIISKFKHELETDTLPSFI
jgi:hypothetical protein